ncbi:beta-3 adrenergic receptor [Biomphalaria glabrata]
MENNSSLNMTQCLPTQGISRNTISNNLHAIVFFAVIGAMIAVFTFLLNLTIFIALLRFKRPLSNENKITRIIMTSMILVDLLLSIFTTPPGTLLWIANGKWTLGLPMFKIWQSYSAFLGCVAANHIFSMALDKYLAISRPTRYRVISDKIGYIMTALAWFVPFGSFAVLFSVPSQGLRNTDYDICFNGDIIAYITQNFYKFNLLTVYTLILLPVLLSYILYVLIFLEIRRWLRRTEKYVHIDRTKPNDSAAPKVQVLPETLFKISQRFALFDLQNLTEKNTSTAWTETKYKSALQCRRHFKAVRTIGSIVIGFTIGWLPTMTTSILLSQGHHIGMEIFMSACWVMYLNCTFNSILCVSVKFVRLAVRRVLE